MLRQALAASSPSRRRWFASSRARCSAVSDMFCCGGGVAHSDRIRATCSETVHGQGLCRMQQRALESIQEKLPLGLPRYITTAVLYKVGPGTDSLDC